MRKVSNGKRRRDIWSIPGPLNVPFIGTKWIFLWKYKMSQIHKVYEGKSSAIFVWYFYEYFFCFKTFIDILVKLLLK